jgi:transcriptional regulator with XRE-family HTH domain
MMADEEEIMEKHLRQEVCDRISDLMREERKARKITQIDMADTLGVTQSNISKIEQRIATPPTEIWLHFCKLFALSPALPMNQKAYDAHMDRLQKKVEKNKKSRTRIAS